LRGGISRAMSEVAEEDRIAMIEFHVFPAMDRKFLYVDDGGNVHARHIGLESLIGMMGGSHPLERSKKRTRQSELQVHDLGFPFVYFNVAHPFSSLSRHIEFLTHGIEARSIFSLRSRRNGTIDPVDLDSINDYLLDGNFTYILRFAESYLCKKLVTGIFLLAGIEMEAPPSSVKRRAFGMYAFDWIADGIYAREEEISGPASTRDTYAQLFREADEISRRACQGKPE
jgi:hypothetical protein